MNLIQLKSFFSYIISTEKIKDWNPNLLEKEKKNFFFWEEIYKSYYILQYQLLKKGKAYPGMLFRISFFRLKHFLIHNKNVQIVFLMTKYHLIHEYEKKFMNQMIHLNQKSIIIDHLSNDNKNKKDNYYDFFIKKKCQPISISEIINFKLNQIKIISVSKELEQVSIVEKLICKLIKNGKKPHQIVIILGDNYLSIPLFHSLKKIIGVNLSIMNYPFKYLPIHSTFYSVFQLLLRKEKFKKFHKKDIMRILFDGYIQKIFFWKKKLSLIMENLNTENSDFLSESMIHKYLSKNDLEIIFQIQTNSAKKCLIGIISFIKLLKNFFFLKIEKHMLELKFLSRLEVYMKKLKILVRKAEDSFFGIKDVFNIYQQFINTEKIQYRQLHAHKEKGLLPVIGFMDKNPLLSFEDFEITIMTSVNEGIIPPDKKKYNTFIPFDIRKKLNLPIFQENEEIYFHHFRNILQTSKNVYLIYKNQPDELNSGEKSRFIHQIEMNYDFSTEKKENIPFINFSKRSPLVIKKTESMIQRLYELASHGFSPSSIHLYNCNPLLFYYKKIIGLKNIEEISFKQKIGKIVHKILEILYNPIKGHLLTIDCINTIKKNYESITNKFLLETQKTFLSSMEGKKMLILSIVKTYINNFILWDEKFVHKGHQIVIKELEYSLSTKLDIRFQKKVNLYGIIDRIDECDGITRIIDYKIGTTKLKNIHIYLNKIENIFHNPNHGNIMQLLIYVYLWFKSSKFLGYKKKPPIIGIVSPEKGGENSMLITPIIFFHKKKMNISYKNYIKNFLPHLMNRIYEILDPKTPIIENNNTNFSFNFNDP